MREKTRLYQLWYNDILKELYDLRDLSQKIFKYFKKHFNPTSLVDSVAPEKLSGNLPEFVCELQNISNNFPINYEVPTIDEIQKFRPFYNMLGHFTILYMKGLKLGKVSNDVDSELLKKYEHPFMLQVIDRMANNLWSNLDIPAVWGNSRLKTF